MEINLNVKIKGGKRTPVTVTVYGTAANEKTLEFSNGRGLTETQIAEWIEQELGAVLKRIQGAQRLQERDEAWTLAVAIDGLAISDLRGLSVETLRQVAELLGAV